MLTIVTQIGGIILILSFGYFKISKRPIARWKKLFSFSILYLLSTLLIVPALAKLNGRVPLLTRLYRIGISNHLEETSEDFEIFGELERGWERFMKNTNYRAFIRKLRDEDN